MSIFNKVFKKKEEYDKNSEIRKKVNNGSDKEAVESNIDNVDIKDEKMTENYAKTGKISFGYRVIVKPLVTEKTANLAKRGKYVFEIKNGVNKIEVKKALESVYGVEATDVNIIKMKGKKIGATRKIFGKRKDWKKAVCTLKKGESIIALNFIN